MKNSVRLSALAALMLCLFAFTAFMPAGHKTITLVNRCKFSIHEVYLSAVDEDNWGDDLLDKDEILKPGESIEIEIDCGQWDARLVAEDGSTCEVPNVDICSADTWEVTADCGK